jgi:outer membrane protein TolC
MREKYVSLIRLPSSMNRLVGVIYFVLISIFPVDAQVSFPYSLSLDSAVEKALLNNPQTKIAESRLRTAELQLAEARTGKRPSLLFSQSTVRSNDPVFVFGTRLQQGRFTVSDFALNSLNNPAALTNIRFLVSGQMPLFDQHQTSSRIAVADTSKKQAELHAEAVGQHLRFDVIRAYYGVILGQEKLKVSDGAVRSAEANCKKTRDMADTGMTTEADYLAAEVELANAGQQKLEAHSELVVSKAALNLLLGDDPGVERFFTGDLQERFFWIEEQDALIRTAFASRPDYISAGLAVEKSHRETKAVKDLSLPRIDAFGNVGHSSPYIANGSTDYTVGVSLTYTLFDAGRKARQEQAAEAETHAEAEKQALANQIVMEVVKAYQAYLTAQQKIKVSIKSISQAEEALRIVQDRYKFGLTTFNEVIRAETALVRAKHNLLGARYEYYVAYASVLLATGQLTDVRAF